MKTLCSVVLVLAAGCGGSVLIDDADAGRDAGATRDAHRESGRVTPESGAASDAGANADNYVVFREDACPTVTLEPPSLECDPFAATSGCGIGEGCYPIPPQGTDNCHPGSYATRCFSAGSGAQGDSCGGGDDCQGGFICVKTAAGDQCVRLCRIEDVGTCGPGRMCVEVDVTGANWGGCQ